MAEFGGKDARRRDRRRNTKKHFETHPNSRHKKNEGSRDKNFNGPNRQQNSEIARNVIKYCNEDENMYHHITLSANDSKNYTLDSIKLDQILKRDKHTEFVFECDDVVNYIFEVSDLKMQKQEEQEEQEEQVRKDKIISKSKTACLNFASGKNICGGFLKGSTAQEECLARASGLYSVLLSYTDVNPDTYHEKNKRNERIIIRNIIIIIRFNVNSNYIK